VAFWFFLSHHSSLLLYLSPSSIFQTFKPFLYYKILIFNTSTCTMQFTISAVILALAGFAAAAPAEALNNSVEGHERPRFKVPDGMTVKEAQAKCGDQAQLSCCNKATYAGDTTDVNSGMLGGTLSNLIGAGSGADGVGIFDQCSKLDVQSKLFSMLNSVVSILTDSQSPSSSQSPSRTSSTSAASRTLPAVPTLLPAPTPTLLVPVFLALPLAPSCKQFAYLRSCSLRRKSYRGPVVYLSFVFVLHICSRFIAL
jgi:hypothetical protein